MPVSLSLSGTGSMTGISVSANSVLLLTTLPPLPPSPASPPPPENLRVVPTATPLVYDVVWTKPASVNPCPDVVYQVTVTNNVTGEVEVEASSSLTVCVDPHSCLSLFLQAEGAIRESITFNDTDSVMCQLHEFEVKTSVGEAFSSPTIERVALPLSESRPHPLTTPTFHVFLCVQVLVWRE